MNSYQKEQSDALNLVCHHLASISERRKRDLLSQISGYLSFRDDADDFLCEHFNNICTQKCYQSKISACCSREGIITFFADIVINALVSSESEIQALMKVLQKPNRGFKCVYLGKHGCMWRIKPLICEMFLCDHAEKEVFTKKPDAEKIWRKLKQSEKRYRWPDRPVLFDNLERYFIKAGYSSPLMYLHNSPGLLRVKRQVKKNKE